MSKGMIIQCGGCGFSRFVNLEGDFNAREAELNSVIREGWRHVYSWKGFICPKCRTNGTDKLYETFAGKPKPSGELATYIELRWDADQMVAALKEGGG
jgi:hypothetical protein